MGTLPQALKIIFELQNKRNNGKKKTKNKFSNLQNTFFPIFFCLDPSPFSNLITFLILFILNDLKWV
jgi:hypothetical protein